MVKPQGRLLDPARELTLPGRVAGAHRMNRRAPRYERGADSCRTITTLGYAMKNPMRSMFR